MPASVVLHVGMPKCGSSALQTALSARPDLPGDPAARYAVLHASGNVFSGAQMAGRVAGAASGYSVSARAAQLDELGSIQFARIALQLEQLSRDARLVLSNEGWGNEYAAFSRERYLERLGITAEVVLYVRPQVGWCNSAWWQWGAWNEPQFNRWLRRQIERIQWGEVAAQWSRVPGVSHVRVRLLPQNIVADFCQTIGVAPVAEVKANASLPGAVLRLFQRHKQLRGGPHDSAIEFAIGRHLRLADSPTPWVLRGEHVALVLDSCRQGNLALLEYLDEPQREQMRLDAAWWEADHYSSRKIESWRPLPPDPLESDRLAAAALQALFELDGRYRELARQQIDNGSRTAQSGTVAADGWLSRLLGRSLRG